jgi:hypothetical protein
LALIGVYVLTCLDGSLKPSRILREKGLRRCRGGWLS